MAQSFTDSDVKLTFDSCRLNDRDSSFVVVKNLSVTSMVYATLFSYWCQRRFSPRLVVKKENWQEQIVPDLIASVRAEGMTENVKLF